MVDFGFLAIDCQKIRANASFKRSKTRERIRSEIRRIEKQMELLLGKEPSEDLNKKNDEDRRNKLSGRYEAVLN